MNTGTSRSDWVGRVIDGRFPLLQWLGDSEGGSVFLTELRDAGLQKAAIKLIPADAGNAEARLDLWSRAAALSHPHLMRLFYFGRCHSHTGELLYAVTEFAEENLALILPERPLTAVEAAEMLPPILDALSYLHGEGFVHGSLKPSNILVVGDQLKLSCDRLQLVGAQRSEIPALRVYDAPECAAGKFSPASDIWALGVTLVVALSQHPPVWEREEGGEPSIPESLPEPFAAIARECLRSDPARRCTLREVQTRLQATQSFIQTMSKFRWPTLAVAALVLIAALSVFYFRSHPSESAQTAGDQQPVPATTALPAPVPASGLQSQQGAVVKSTVADQVLPDVSPKASSSIRGKVEISVRVSADSRGAVTNAELDAPSNSKYFANQAVQAAQRWRFKPARVDGRAVSSEWILHFHFGQTGTEVTAVETAP